MNCPKCGGHLVEADDEYYFCKDCGSYFQRQIPKSKMYKNIGKKIKTLTAVVTIILIVCSIILGIGALFNLSDAYEILGKNVPFFEGFEVVLEYFIIFPLLIWAGSFFAYGFGDLIERTKKNNENTEVIIEMLTEICEKESLKEEKKQ